MNNLFIRLYLDEDVHVLVADLLQARGFDVVTARDAGKLQISDEEQLAYAVSQSRVLVTHNRTDFEILVQDYFASEPCTVALFTQCVALLKTLLIGSL